MGSLVVFVGLILFIVGVLVLIEFFLMSRRLSEIRTHARSVDSNLVKLANLIEQSVLRSQI